MKNKPWNTNTEKEALAMLYLLPAAHSDRPGCGPAFSMALLNSMWTQILKTVSSFAAIVQLAPLVTPSSVQCVSFGFMADGLSPRQYSLQKADQSLSDWVSTQFQEHSKPGICGWPYLSEDQGETQTLCTTFTVTLWQPLSSSQSLILCGTHTTATILSLCLAALGTWVVDILTV